MESRATLSSTSTTTKSPKRKLAERLLSLSFILFSLLLACAFLFPEDVIPASFKNEQHKRKKQMEKEQRLVASAHHEDDERTFHDILNDHEKERETFMQSHDEAVKVHSEDDEEEEVEEMISAGAAKKSGGDEEADRFSNSKHPDLSRVVREKLQRYDHSASAALVLKQQLATGKKCRESECAKIGKGGVPAKAINKGNPFSSLGPLCFQESLLDAKATEFGLSWDKKSTKDDWFVHQKTASEDSKFKMELLPESAKGVTKIMNRGSSTSSSGRDSSTSATSFKTCALVGNSAILSSGPAAGKFIDAHDVVFRLNQAPTKKYEDRVGKKTTVRILNKSWVLGYGGTLRLEHGNVKESDLPNEDGVLFLASRGNFQAITKLMNKFRSSSANGDENIKVLRMNFKLYDVISAQLKRFRSCLASKKQTFTGGTTPSSGLMASLLLAGRCDEVNLYGFGPGTIRGKYQYYTLAGSERAHGESVHAFGLEFAFLKAMDKIGLVKVCRPPMDDERCRRGL